MNKDQYFETGFLALTGNLPFPWQSRLYRRFVGDVVGGIPSLCSLPTGLGKTSVIAVWLLALAKGAPLPRRLVYVVNRRTVVDQTTDEMMQYRRAIASDAALSALKPLFDPLPISTLRGLFADNGQWCEDPSRPAIICGTVDMVGSRLLFSGYGLGFKTRPLHAGFLAQDSLLIHDEAHLEPAFQILLERIALEQLQREPDVPWPKFQVMELTATSQTSNPFQLDASDYSHPVVKTRINASKPLYLHQLSDHRKPQKELTAKAMQFANSGKAILVFASSIESVLDICSAITKSGLPAKSLTGTMRGKERDELVQDKIFARFLPTPPEDATAGTVYLICTSAGEVGINISADCLVCDLSTYERMAQRFGRVNRFGNASNCEIHVFYPIEWDNSHSLTAPRKNTLELLRSLKGMANPKSLSELPADKRAEAFAPKPTMLPASEILFDAWSMTTLRGKLPGRPEVEPWLHGLLEYELPQTRFAWREEVQHLSGNDVAARVREEVLDAYPIQQHELLTEPSYRAFQHLQKLAKRTSDSYAWIVHDSGQIDVTTLSVLADKENKASIERVTILLAPECGGLSATGILDGNSESANDISSTLDRCRCWSNEEVLKGMHEVYSFVLPSTDEDEEPEVWRWLARRNTGEVKSRKPVLLAVHIHDVESRLAEILEKLSLGEQLDKCLMISAKHHDEGKNRAIFQSMLGNRNSNGVLWAKSGRRSNTVLAESYRHEFGSLHELPNAIELNLTDHDHELVLHLIAAHHGRARPHFPLDEIFDPDSTPDDDQALAVSVVQRFGRMQRRYGRWGLAYLESLLRAADWSASANPSAEVEAR